MGPGSTLSDMGAAISSFIFGAPMAPNETSIPLISPVSPVLLGPGPGQVGPGPAGPPGIEVPDITPTLALPTEEKVAAKEAANAEMERRRKKQRGIYTSPGGILTPAPTKKATLG